MGLLLQPAGVREGTGPPKQNGVLDTAARPEPDRIPFVLRYPPVGGETGSHGVPNSELRVNLVGHLELESHRVLQGPTKLLLLPLRCKNALRKFGCGEPGSLLMQ